MLHMPSVGIRELRQRASELLRRVEGGETIEITDRGRLVAVLAPVPDAGAIARLRATGAIEAARGDVDDLPAPIKLPPGAELPSELLTRLRRHER